MKKGQLRIIVAVMIIGVIVLGILVIVANFGGITGNVIPPPTCRNVQVPYNQTEYYPETIPVEKDVPLRYTASKSKTFNCGSLFDYYACVDISVTNLDVVGGTFRVDCDFRRLHGTLSDSNSGYVKPGDTTKIRCDKNIERSDDVDITYDVTPPTKQEIDYEEVQRKRIVVKYKTERQCD